LYRELVASDRRGREKTSNVSYMSPVNDDDDNDNNKKGKTILVTDRVGP
jgi:hypothetical protein